MDAGFGSSLFCVTLGVGALGGMLGIAGGILIALAAATIVAALIYAISGFGFAVLAAPLFLLFLDPARAIQLVIIISTALSIVVVPGLLRAIAPWLLAASRRRSGQRGERKHWTAFAMSPGRDLAAGAVSGIANAVVGWPGRRC